MANRRAAERSGVCLRRGGLCCSPHRDRSKYNRKGYEVSDDFPTCVMCDANVSFVSWPDVRVVP